MALVRGRLPQGLHEFMAMYVRYVTHVAGYISLAANPYPGFTGQPGYLDVSLPDTPQPPVAVVDRSPAPARARGAGAPRRRRARDGRSRVRGRAGVAAVCALLGWFAILALGRMPVGLRNLAAYGLGYTAQAYAYVLLVTDRYPNSDPDAIGPGWDRTAAVGSSSRTTAAARA